MAEVEEDWSAGRREKDALEERMAQERAIEGLRAVNALLKKFSQDDDLKEDLQKPQVIMALKHWTGVQRLPPEQATRLFAEDYHCRSVLDKLRLLQAECTKAGIPVPLDHMMQGIPELQLGGNSSSSKKGDKAGKEKEKSSKAKEATAASSDAKPSARRRSTSKAASEKAEKTGGKAEKAGETASVVAPPPPNPWAFLLSVCMILFGVWFSWYSSGGAQ